MFHHVFDFFVLYVPGWCGIACYAFFRVNQSLYGIVAILGMLYVLWKGINWYRLYKGVKAIRAAIPAGANRDE
jgi:hypothetical protein